MSILTFVSIFFLLQFVCVFVGRKASKAISSQDDYFLAGRKLGFFPLMMTLVATQVGGGLVLGSAEEAYRYGWTVFLYPLGATLGLLTLSLGIGKRMARFNVGTIAGLFEVVYNSKNLKKFASLLSIISLFLILIAQVIASKKFMVSCGVSSDAIFLGFWFLVILYTVLGGLKAVVATDMVQALFFIVIFLAGFLYTLFSGTTVSFMEVLQTESASNFEFNGSKMVGWLLMPLLFMVIEQDMGQRCFAAKSGKTVTLATLIAALVTVFTCMIPLFYGVFAKMKGIEIREGSSILMDVVAATTNPLMTALIGCAILAAIISTADSLMNAISSNVAQDFGLKIKNIRGAQSITALISVCALLSAYAFNNVVDLLMLSYELSVSALFAPIFMALFLKKGKALSATLSIACGAMGFIVFRFTHVSFFPKEILCLVFSFIGFFMGEIMSKQKVVEGSTI